MNLDVVVYETPEGWMASTLQSWLFCQSESRDCLDAELRRVIDAHVRIAKLHGREPFSYLPKAPERFWGMFARGYGDDRWSVCVDRESVCELTVRTGTLTS